PEAINVNGTDSKLAIINVLKRTPTISWNTPADITYETALSSTQLNAASSVPRTFVYTPPSGIILSAGIQILHVVFTPTDTTNYNTASADVQINVIAPPIAYFSATPTFGTVSLNVAFTDASTGTPTSWNWDFGDGNTSTDQNPVNEYSTAGKYTVSLTVKNAAGSDNAKKNNFITVNTVK
ncbi:MAG: PKD domain-containing protein, partial [Bacteroidota bacterium]|nr:PKD domain-containing protein [Bacteroidota bacterium]